MNRKKQIIVIGGGTGTHTVLTGLKYYQDTLDLTAIVAMTDSGGSTGRLRDEFGYLPVGDVRMALTALASENGDEDALLRKLFLHRFDTNGDISGHNFGNLFLVALTDILGTEEAAIEAASRVLRVCGRVLPVTTEKVHLVAEYDDGTVVVGEHEIDMPKKHETRRMITLLRTEPTTRINPRAQEILSSADLIVFGPGDLYTSVLANCAVDGFVDALMSSRAKRVYISNLMTKSGQTDGMGVKEHVAALAQYTGRYPDVIMWNSSPLPPELLERYKREDEYPVLDNADDLSVDIIRGDYLAREEIITPKGDVLRRSLLRHDPHKLARALVSLL